MVNWCDIIATILSLSVVTPVVWFIGPGCLIKGHKWKKTDYVHYCKRCGWSK